MFALLLFCNICAAFSLSFFRVCQFLICHFNGLPSQRLVLVSSNLSVVFEAKFQVLISAYIGVRELNCSLKPRNKLNISLD